MLFSSLDEAFPEINFNNNIVEERIIEVPEDVVEEKPGDIVEEFHNTEMITPSCRDFDNHMMYCDRCNSRYRNSDDNLLFFISFLLFIWFIFKNTD